MKWIRMMDESPKENGLYLIYVVGGYLIYDLAIWNNQRKAWEALSAGVATHWMQLEPPKNRSK